MSYYQRDNIVHLDGTHIFQTDEDRTNEGQIAAVLGKKWNCEFHRFGALAPVDWYAIRHSRIVGISELKSRTHSSLQYPTVFLNVRKWLALQLASIGMGVPGLFVVRFTDAIAWIAIADIDPRRMIVGGCSRVVKAASDVEPVIEVPIATMRCVEKLPGANT
jgi:hypothetical protein